MNTLNHNNNNDEGSGCDEMKLEIFGVNLEIQIFRQMFCLLFFRSFVRKKIKTNRNENTDLGQTSEITK